MIREKKINKRVGGGTRRELMKERKGKHETEKEEKKEEEKKNRGKIE